MKKVALFSLLSVSVLFTACGEETKKVAAEVNTTAVVEAVKKDTVSAVEAAKIKAAEIAQEAKIEAEKIAAASAEKAAEAAEAVKEKTAELTQAATAALTPVSPPVAYDKCKGCHGVDGKTKALGKSAVIAGQDKEAIITSMNEYKEGTKNVAGMGTLMKAQAAPMSDADIEAVAEYLSQI